MYFVISILYKPSTGGGRIRRDAVLHNLPHAHFHLPLPHNLHHLQPVPPVQNEDLQEQALLLLLDCFVLVQHIPRILPHTEPVRLEPGKSV